MEPTTLTPAESAVVRREFTFVEELQARVDGTVRTGPEFGCREVRNKFVDARGAEARQVRAPSRLLSATRARPR